MQALFRGCDKLGIGSFVRPDGQKNLCSYLEDEDRNCLNGTRIPDLGPKLYIARPRMVKTTEGNLAFEGDTFTRVHCDLADAVNYSFGDGDALWTVFAAKARSGELLNQAASEETVLSNISTKSVKFAKWLSLLPCFVKQLAKFDPPHT